jgi:hypothetical protein
MWGFANERNRYLAKFLFKIITNPHIASYYNPGGKNSEGKIKN